MNLGFFSKEKNGLAFWLCSQAGNKQSNVDLYSNLYKFSQDKEQYSEFLSDYFSGNIPYKVNEQAVIKGLDNNLGWFIKFHLTGMEEGLPFLFKEVYNFKG